MDWYDKAMAELDEWFESGPHTPERMEEYRRCQRNLDREWRETME